jgi:hypothetical protein
MEFESPAVADTSAPDATPAPAPEQAEPKPGGIQSEIRLAAQRLASRREEVRKEREAAAQAEQAPAPIESPPQEGDTAPETVSGEIEATEPEPTPSVPPPRSWASEDHDAFRALPPEVQARMVEIDRSRELEVQRVQSRLAEITRADEARAAAMEQARQQYEQSLAYAMQLAGSDTEFADIKSMDDVTRLARDDWPRYVQWDAHQKKLQALGQEYQQAQQRQHYEYSQRWNQFAEGEDQKFAQKYPDAAQIRDDAVNYLKTSGFSQDEMAQHWNSGIWRDARMQAVLRDATLYNKAQKAKAEAVKKPVPPVQRPGVQAARPSSDANEIKALESKGGLSLKEAARLSILRGKTGR